jgi:hypothetical protein
VLAVSTLALIVFHELGARMGVVTEKGLLTLVRDHYGPPGAIVALTALVVANLGTLCAGFAGVAAGLDPLGSSSERPARTPGPTTASSADAPPAPSHRRRRRTRCQ